MIQTVEFGKSCRMAKNFLQFSHFLCRPGFNLFCNKSKFEQQIQHETKYACHTKKIFVSKGPKWIDKNIFFEIPLKEKLLFFIENYKIECTCYNSKSFNISLIHLLLVRFLYSSQKLTLLRKFVLFLELLDHQNQFFVQLI